MKPAAGIIGAVVLLLAVAAGGQTLGWRGNGTGLYPDADPPVEWGRRPKGPIRDLCWQINRPTAEKPGDDARPLKQYLIKEWLVLGPFPADKDLLGHAYVPDEAKLQPSEGEKVGNLAWKPMPAGRAKPHDTGTQLDFTRFGSIHGRKGEKLAYAHAYLHSRSAGKVVFVIDHAAGLKAWVNGRVVYEQRKGNLSIWAMNNISWGMGKHLPTPFGVKARRVAVALDEGWNRVLLKTSGNVHLRLTAAPGAAYDSKNIVWATELPDFSNAHPVIVGEKVFVMCEPDLLMCLAKSDGRILWQRSNSFYDSVSDEDRRKDPAYEKLIAPLHEKLTAAKTYEEKVVLRKRIHDALLGIDKARFEMVIEGHATSHRPIAGWSTPTPCSDGKNVYVWVTNGVAACYDLDGNRRWIQRADLLLKSPEDKHGPYRYPCSPLLVGGKFVIAVPAHGLVALSAADGTPAWKNTEIKGSMIALGAAKVRGTELIISSGGDALRASDGKVLHKHNARGHVQSATTDDGVFYLRNQGLWAIDFSRADRSFRPVVRDLKIGTVEGFGGSPLYHDGLLYIVSSKGVLHVVDVTKAALAYKQPLDLAPMFHYNACGVASSPTLGGKHIYIFDNQGNAIVFEPGRKFKQVAANAIRTLVDRFYPLDPQEVTTYACPVFEGGRMYLRGERHLYCIGEK